MTAAVSSFDIVAVPSVLVDRRALSQAWYDALHLAERGCRAPFESRGNAVAVRPPAAQKTFARNAVRNLASSSRAPSRATARGRAETAELPVTFSHRDRRAAPSPLARRIAARLQTAPGGAAAVSFWLATPRGRVHVCVRRLAGGVRLFALCPPALRAEVEAAVAQARFALAGSGVAVVW